MSAFSLPPSPSSSPDYAAAVEYLRALKSRGVSLGLDRMRRFVEVLGDPQDAVPCIHIAGTNGKGSVAAMIETILRAAGWRTGLYTSPHLVRLGERVQVNRQLLAPDEIAAWASELRPTAERLEAEFGSDEHPSYFEFMTAMAFLHFRRSRCDVACIEVGLGGRLDATNVVVPEVSVITSIGLDHLDVLGATVGEIAAEKAGIVKPGRPLVIGRLPAAAETVIREIAGSRDAPVISVREKFGDDLARYPQTNLEGDYQRWNAATATLVAETLPARWKLDSNVVARALLNVDWPGRWQRFTMSGRHVILDTAHNSEGAGVLDVQLARVVAATGRPPIVVAGALGVARARSLVPVFCRHARDLYFVMPAQSRACRFEELEALIEPSFRGRVVRSRVEDLFPAAGVCTAGEEGDTIVVAGSVYLAGEVLARIDPTRGPSESALQDF
jgi:dihydrofolate synthase/folylpolyglutamate synthase